MDIRKIKKTDVPFISALHMKMLPTSIARIGNPYLSELYDTLLKDIGLVAIDHGSIVGVITATANLKKTHQNVKCLLYHPSTLWTIGKAIVLRRVTIGSLFERMAAQAEILSLFPDPYATILTFFVDKKNQHQGIGTKLLSSLEKQFPVGTKLCVDTATSNTNAQQWYKFHGFRSIKTIRNTIVLYLSTQKRDLFLHREHTSLA